MAAPPLAGWPASPGAARDQRILDAVKAGDFEHTWCPLVLGSQLEVLVSCDALRIDGVRVSMSAHLQQLVADELDALLLTPKLVDAIYAQSTKTPPQTLPPDHLMASTARMIEHSRKVDGALGGGGGGIHANVGKDWVLIRGLFTPAAQAARKAANYGWLGTGGARSVTGLKAIQDVGTKHNDRHVDYSQVGRYAHRSAKFDGVPIDLADAYTGRSAGNHLVSHEGPLPGARQPTVTAVGGSGPTPLPPPAPPPNPPGEDDVGPAPSVPVAGRGGGAGPTMITAGLGAGAGYALGGGTGAAIGGVVGWVLGAFLRRR